MNQNYAERIYKLAISAPEVDIFDEDEVEVYIRQKAKELCLDPDAIAEQAMAYDAEMADLKEACEMCQ